MKPFVTLLQRLGVNRAVGVSLVYQLFMMAATPVTMLVIIKRLSPQMQGYYYTFNSVLGLQVFVELGLAMVIVHVASHEWASLERTPEGGIRGSLTALSRLRSLLRLSTRWYGIAGLVLVVVVGSTGYWFFASRSVPGISWAGPWISLCLVAGVALTLSPFFSVIEGCDQVASIYSYRLLQAVLSSAALVGAFFCGLGLWALVFAAAVRLVVSVCYLLSRHRLFIRDVLHAALSETISWKSEIWPFQWRIAVSWLSGYFISSLFVPVMFRYQGPVVAGQMGMTLAIAGALESASYAWIGTRIPRFGVLVAQGRYEELDQLFFRLLGIVVALASGGAAILSAGVYWIDQQHLPIALRVLPFALSAVLFGQRVISIVVSAFAFYLRSHKREPMMMVSMTTALLVATSTLVLGSTLGPNGAVLGFAAVTIIWGLPSALWVFHICRRDWHAVPEPAIASAALP